MTARTAAAAAPARGVVFAADDCGDASDGAGRLCGDAASDGARRLCGDDGASEGTSAAEGGADLVSDCTSAAPARFRTGRRNFAYPLPGVPSSLGEVLGNAGGRAPTARPRAEGRKFGESDDHAAVDPAPQLM